MLLRSKTKTKSDKLWECMKQEEEPNFYERVMADMEEAGQTQIVDFLKDLKAKEEAKEQLDLTDK